MGKCHVLPMMSKGPKGLLKMMLCEDLSTFERSDDCPHFSSSFCWFDIKISFGTVEKV